MVSKTVTYKRLAFGTFPKTLNVSYVTSSPQTKTKTKENEQTKQQITLRGLQTIVEVKKSVT